MHLVRFDARSLAPYALPLDRPGDYPRSVATGCVPGAPVLRVIHPEPMPFGDVVIRRLERHPHSAQTFLPLRVGMWLVVLAPTDGDGQPDISGAVWTLAGPGDALMIHRDVWHAPLAVLEPGSVFAMIMWSSAAGDDGVVADLVRPIVLPREAMVTGEA